MVPTSSDWQVILDFAIGIKLHLYLFLITQEVWLLNAIDPRRVNTLGSALSLLQEHKHGSITFSTWRSRISNDIHPYSP